MAPALANAVERAVDDAFRNGFLAVVHQAVHELAENDIAELRIGQNFPLFGAMTARHASLLLAYFGRLAPYLERRWRRSFTPWVSSVPRMMRSEEHTSELQSLMRISYAVFCLKKKTS